MKYYRIEQDDKVQHLPQMVNWFNVINEKYLHKGNYHMIADKTMIYIKHDEQVVFPDAMIYPFHGFTEPIKKKIALYEPNMGFKTVFLVDKSNKNFQRYFIPFLSEYDCMHEQSITNLDKSKITKVVLDKAKIPYNKAIFLLGGVNTRCVIARIDLIEGILREDVYGLKLTSVEMKEDEHDRDR